MFNALYVNPSYLLSRAPTEEVTAASSIMIAVLGAREGGVLRQHTFTDLYEKLIGKAETEQQMLDAAQARLLTLERITPHKIVIRGARVGEDEVREFRGKQGTWRSGRASTFYSYSIGTILYFSEQTEAVMAKIVLDTPDRNRLDLGGWQSLAPTTLHMHNPSPGSPVPASTGGVV